MILDQNDEILLSRGTLSQTITISRDGNTLRGGGEFNGNINYVNKDSDLTWRLDTNFKGDGIYLQGGALVLSNDLRFGSCLYLA